MFETALETPFFPPLSRQRRGKLLSIIKSYGRIASLLEIGCGSGPFLDLCINGQQSLLAGVDIDLPSLEEAKRVLKPRSNDLERDLPLELLLYACSFTQLKVSNVDCVVAIEVVEHLDPEPLALLGPTVLGRWKPRLFVMSTPNVEYNAILGVQQGKLRHDDHRFEWTRKEFQDFCGDIAERFGYHVAYTGVGKLEGGEQLGFATQIAVFWNDSDNSTRVAPPLIEGPGLFARYEYPATSTTTNMTDGDAFRLLLNRAADLKAVQDRCSDCPFFGEKDCLPLTFGDFWGVPEIRRTVITPEKLVALINKEGKSRIAASIKAGESKCCLEPWHKAGMAEGELLGEEILLHCNRRLINS